MCGPCTGCVAVRMPPMLCHSGSPNDSPDDRDDSQGDEGLHDGGHHVLVLGKTSVEECHTCSTGQQTMQTLYAGLKEQHPKAAAVPSGKGCPQCMHS